MISDSKTGLVRDHRIARIWRKAAKQLDADLVSSHGGICVQANARSRADLAVLT